MDISTVGFIAATAAIFHILGIMSAIKAIMESRTPQGATAWALGLVTFPYLAVPAYWVFGRSKFQGFVKLFRENQNQIDPMVRHYIDELKRKKLIVFPDRQEALPIEKIAKLPFTAGNQAELLVDGKATFDSIFEGIERAQHYVLVQFYIVACDDLGNDLKKRMIDKARQGVRVYFLYDEIGSLKLGDKYVAELAEAGVKAHKFDTTKGRSNRFQLNFRNHRKIVVVDGQEAWVGGHNVADEYLGENAGLDFWRDTHVRLAGPVAQSLQMSFAEDWNWASDGDQPDLNWEARAAEGEHTVAALALPSGPDNQFETCTLFFVEAIHSAKKRLWIASPYFVPDEQFMTALHLAVIRGVDVRILIPVKTDNPLVTYTHWSYVEDLKRIGVNVSWYKKGFLHQKVVLVDDDYAMIGTANFDNRSFRLNFEVTVVIADFAFNDEVARMLEDDFHNGTAVTDEEIKEQGFLFRFAVRAARLTAPIQ
ncbi:MAG: cardiolipin synthase [Halioglobus sp.]